MNSKTTMTQLTSHKSHAIPLEEIVVLSDQDGIPSGAKYLAIEVQDNSMAPLLTMGSTAIVQFQLGVDDGDIAAAIFDNGNIVIRKVQKIGDKIGKRLYVISLMKVNNKFFALFQYKYPND